MIRLDNQQLRPEQGKVQRLSAPSGDSGAVPCNKGIRYSLNIIGNNGKCLYTYERLTTSYQHNCNSLYGALGSVYFFCYNAKMAGSVTSCGQTIIKTTGYEGNKFIAKIAGKTNYDDLEWIAAGDTDSVVGSTKIYSNGRQIEIKDFYESINSKPIVTKHNAFVKKVHNCVTKSVENDKIVSTEIKYVMKHTITKKLYKLTINGKEVIITEDHSIVYEHDGKIVSGTVNTIAKGDKVLFIDN